MTSLRQQEGEPLSLEDMLLEDVPEGPLGNFYLAEEDHRRAFLEEVFARGYEALFEAVAHVWDSLEEPRVARGTAIGLASKTGGKGKSAILFSLTRFIDEGLAAIEPLPDRSLFDTFEAWSDAAIATFETDRGRVSELARRYAAILDGTAPSTAESQPSTNVVLGPWRARR